MEPPEATNTRECMRPLPSVGDQSAEGAGACEQEEERSEGAKTSNLPPCPYGKKCYRYTKR